jgi:predicted alpha/beta-hydrolase family hydrolase
MNATAPPSGAARSAIVAPGGGSGVDGPLLMYARLAVQSRGGQVHPIRWEHSRDSDFRLQRQRVASQVESAVEEMTAATGAAPVVIGKSLGSLAAPVVADRGLPAVWFTPLLTDEPTVAALRRATGPCLLVGGTADGFWDGQAARSLPAEVVEVVEVDGADHRMFVPGRLGASAAVLGQVITAVEDFLDNVVWR